MRKSLVLSIAFILLALSRTTDGVAAEKEIPFAFDVSPMLFVEGDKGAVAKTTGALIATSAPWPLECEVTIIFAGPNLVNFPAGAKPISKFGIGPRDFAKEDSTYQSQAAIELPEEAASLYSISRVHFGTGVRYKTSRAGVSKVAVHFDAGNLKVLEAAGVRMLFFLIDARPSRGKQERAISLQWLHIDDIPRLEPAPHRGIPPKPKEKPEYRQPKKLSMAR